MLEGLDCEFIVFLRDKIVSPIIDGFLHSVLITDSIKVYGFSEITRLLISMD